MSDGLSTEDPREDLTVGGIAPGAAGLLTGLGRHLGKYRVTGLLGRGGMGVVYRAVDHALEREVALKVLSPDVLRDSESTHQQSERLLREARAQAQITHPNVVTIYDVGREGNEVYLAMALVDGPDLRAWLRARPRAWREVLTVLLAAGRGLVAAHAAGLVHRDFKPSNVLLDRGGCPQVTDFGLARVVLDESFDRPGARPSGAHPLLDDSLTVEGTVVGTPAYMAPEQHAGVVSPAVDQYAFCVTLWEFLAGMRPFAGAGLRELLHAKRAGPPPPPAGTAVPLRVWKVLERGLAPDPDRRFESMATLLQAYDAPSHGRGGGGGGRGPRRWPSARWPGRCGQRFPRPRAASTSRPWPVAGTTMLGPSYAGPSRRPGAPRGPACLRRSERSTTTPGPGSSNGSTRARRAGSAGSRTRRRSTDAWCVSIGRATPCSGWSMHCAAWIPRPQIGRRRWWRPCPSWRRATARGPAPTRARRRTRRCGPR